jgi:hypothetical protein
VGGGCRAENLRASGCRNSVGDRQRLYQVGEWGGQEVMVAVEWVTRGAN